MLGQLSEVYRKIRNTARYILGNINNFNPDSDCVELDLLIELDKWALVKFDELVEKVLAAYENMDFYLAYHALNNFCVVDMSNFYLDIIKDRLYCEGEKSLERRSAQTAMYMILDGLVRLVAPILCFTADEIWEEMPLRSSYDKTSVVFNPMPEKSGVKVDEAFTAKWDKIRAIRDDVLAALEIKRNEKVIGKSLEAKVIIHTNEDLSDIESELAAALIVSQVEIVNGEPQIEVIKADGEKCERCWVYGEVKDELCERCARVVENIAEITGI
jgi:isoleucyl-tRNA synthetase